MKLLDRARYAAQVLQLNMLQRCADGPHNCWCRSASTCLFYRCENCDMPVDKFGKALLDDFYSLHVDGNAGPCPYCDGPMPKL